MDKLKMHTPNRADDNFRKLAALFPNAVTETIDENGEVVRAIDKDVLMQEISCTVVEGRDERYQFTWPDKKKSVLLANAPIAKTLRPCREESVGRDGTPGGFDSENLYIEGDNLEVLKLLQETYLGKVKMIYIDPPYNTGNDFIYEDDFAQNAKEYLANSGQLDEEGNRLGVNMESNGRFHTDWLNMIYPRLKLAKNLLSDDGVVFISIDDNEIANLRRVCDEVFGEQNFVTQFLWTRTSTPPSLSYKCRKTVEYVLCYEKRLGKTRYFGSLLSGGDAPLLTAGNPVEELRFPEESVRFNFMKVGTLKAGVYDKAELLDDITIVDGVNQNAFSMKATFKWRQQMLNDEVAKGSYFICKTNKLSIRFQRPYDEDNFKTPNNFLDLELNRAVGVGTNEGAVKELDDLGMSRVFDFPKPVSLVKYLINMVTKRAPTGVILDFFSGSATTAHAVMQLNAEDGGTRKFILVQIPELTYEGKKVEDKDKEGEKRERFIIDEESGYPVIVKDSEARKAGYWTITHVGKERIRRAGAKIKAEHSLTTKDLDVGFRVLKCDTTNMKEVYYRPEEYNAEMLALKTDNVKEDRAPEDLLFQVMLDLGVELSAPIEEWVIEGKKVFKVAGKYLMACFDEKVTEKTVTEVAKMEPYYFVMRDSSLANDSVATNFEQIFATYSPETVRKVL